MKKFILRLIAFTTIYLLFLLTAITMPPTPRSKESLIFGEKMKDSLLNIKSSNRIIFIGGSNLTFGLDSKTIKDSLHVTPINTALHAGLGLKYMLDHTRPYIHAGDIVIVSPEYAHFFGGSLNGEEVLLWMLLDVSPGDIKNLSYDQWRNILPHLNKYALSKFNPSNYLNVKTEACYKVTSFNNFGDATAHWSMKNTEVTPMKSIYGEFNVNAVHELKNFEKFVSNKKAKMFISYPGLQNSSSINITGQIAKVDRELMKAKLPILSSPTRYRVPDSLIFNSPYHLSKKGVDLRTRLLIQDLRGILNHSTNTLSNHLSME
ncbi:MAG: hypothetical protein V4687_01800 [Bacteroidota bacterium]